MLDKGSGKSLGFLASDPVVPAKTREPVLPRFPLPDAATDPAPAVVNTNHRPAPVAPTGSHQQAAPVTSSSEKIELIPIDRIDEPLVRQRWHYDERDVAKMAETLRREGNGNPLDGQLQPVIVNRKPNGRYEMIEGMTRLLAFRYHALGPEIKAIVRDLPDARSAYRTGFRANEDRNAPSAYDKGMSFAAALKAGVYKNQQELAEDLGIKKQIVSALVAFDRLPDSTRIIIEQNKSEFGYNTATRLASLFEKTGVAEQVDTAAGKIVKGTWTYKKLDEYVNSIEAGGKKPQKKRTTVTKPIDGFGKLRYDKKCLLLDIDLSLYPADTGEAIASRIEKILSEFRHLAAEPAPDPSEGQDGAQQDA